MGEKTKINRTKYRSKQTDTDLDPTLSLSFPSLSLFLMLSYYLLLVVVTLRFEKFKSPKDAVIFSLYKINQLISIRL